MERSYQTQKKSKIEIVMQRIIKRSDRLKLRLRIKGSKRKFKKIVMMKKMKDRSSALKLKRLY